MKIPPETLIKAAVELQPRAVEAPTMQKLLGKATTGSQTALAKAFGVAPQTIKNWRAQGLPGDGSKRKYSWAECFCWWLKRQQDNEERGSRGAGGDRRQELQAIQLESERAALQYRQARAAKLSSEYLPRRYVETELATIFATLKGAIQSIPSELKVRVSPEYAEQLQADAQRICNRALEIAVTRLERITAEETENGSTKNGRPFKRQ